MSRYLANVHYWSRAGFTSEDVERGVELARFKTNAIHENLLTSFPWQKMVNNQDLILSDNPEDEGYIVSSIGMDNDFIIAYTPRGRPIQPDLSKIGSDRVKAYWFNPRSGECLYLDSYSNSERPTFKPWATGRGSDFLLIILSENSDIKLP